MARTCSHNSLAMSPTTATTLIFFAFLAVFSTVNSLTFTDPDTAYAQYLPDWLPAGRQAASFRFKSVRRDALILLHHFSNRTAGDPIYNFWIELKAGKLQATHVFETFVETVTIGQGLDNDQWHTVDYSKDSAGLLRINLNGKAKEIKLNSHRYGSARDRLTLLTHNSVVTIGGIAAGSAGMAPREFGRILGCMDKIKFLTLNGVLQEIPVDSTAGTQDGCVNKCFSSNKCQQGQCINQYYRTLCDCFGTGHEGEFCQTRGNVEVTLQGHNYIQYQYNDAGESVSTDKMRITIQFKVGREHQSGVLFYAAGSSGDVETYIAVYMKTGKIVIKASLGAGEMFEVTSTPALNDDKWHKLFIRHDGRFMLALIDEVSNNHQVTGDNTYFHLNPDVYVGGGPDLKGKPGLAITSNFVGCLKEIYVDYENIVGAVKENATMSMVKFHGGKPIFECLDIGHTPLTFPTKQAQLILNEWTTGALNLQFAFRTSYGDGVMIHTLISIDNTPDGYLTVRLANGTMELKIDLGVTGGTNHMKSVTVGTSLHNTAWHDVSLALRTGNILLTVDGRMVGIPHKHRISSRSSLYLGSDVSGDESGFEGCIRQIRIQGTELLPTEIVGSIMDNGVVIDGCMIALNPCATGEFVCENGGACTHESNGTRCICNGDGYTGSRCQFPIYKRSCEDYFRSGERKSGPKMIDIDGVGPLQAAYVECDFSMGRPKTTIMHNFAAKTLVRSVSATSLDFTLRYREMTPEMLAVVVKSSSQCRQLFSYWCYAAPLRLGRTSALYSPYNKTIDELPTKFHKLECNANKDNWAQDIGYLTDKSRLPITGMRFLKKELSEVSRATLTLGPLECFSSVAASKPNTATFLSPESYLSLSAWTKGTLSFIFRTSTVGTVLFHQTRGDLVPNSMIGMIADEQSFLFEIFMNGEAHNITVETSRPMLDGEWHSLSIVLGSSDILFAVDSGTALLSLPVGEKMGAFRGPLKLGGSDELTNGKIGFSGCVSAVNRDGKDIYIYDYYNEFTQEDIKPGCLSACAAKPCQNGAQCVDKWTSYECVCAHAAHQGQNCEIDNTKDVVSFADPNVYLSYTPSTADILETDIHLSFRTYQTDALLFYANDHLHNFIQLELVEGSMLVFKYNSGRDIVEVVLDTLDESNMMESSNSTETAPEEAEPFNDGLWVDVSIKRTAEKTVLMARDDFMEEYSPIQLLTKYENDPFNGAMETVMPPRLYASADMVDNYTLAMIGGAPDKMTSLPGLQGCVRGVMIGDMPLSVQELAKKVIKGVSTKCDARCSEDVCDNGGSCTEMWSTFRCNCTSTSYTGRMCSRDIGASFQSSSLMMYPFTSYDMEPSESTEKDSLTFGFSTGTANGVLVYIRGDEDEPTERYILVKLVEGNVEASIDFGTGPTTISIEGAFNDGFRHVVELRRYGNRILFDVDHLDGNYTTLSDSEPVLFSKRGALVTGGVEYNMTSFGLEGAGGYEGCIAGLNYNGIRPLELLFGSTTPSDKGGVQKSTCAAFKDSPSTDTSGLPDNAGGDGPDFPDPNLGSIISTRGSAMLSPWNVAPAVGRVYVEPQAQTFKLSPDIIKYIIIAICAAAIVILLLCILCMACKLAKKNKKEKEMQKAKNYDDFDAAPSRYVAPQKQRPLSYQPVPQTEDRPKPARPMSQPPSAQNEPEVVATGQFTVEATPELKDGPPIPMIDEDVEEEAITNRTPLMSAVPMTNGDVPPPVPTSPPPPLTPPQTNKSVSLAEPETTGSATGETTEIPEKKPLVRTESLLSESETAV